MYFLVDYMDYVVIKNKIKECILFGTPIHGNLGDHAIAYAENKLLNTASALKPFTFAAALDTLGNDYKFETDFFL